MPINVNDPEYSKAEEWFHEAKTIDEQLLALNKMISHAPKHKGAENLRQQLTTRRKKLESQLEKSKKSGKGTKQGIRKEDMQAVIIGKTNSGKSSLLKILTNAEPKISQTNFTTTQPQVGMMDYATTSIQLVENPAIFSEYYDKSTPYSTDTCLILVNSLEEINEILKELKTQGKKIIVFNKKDKLSENEKRKIKATLKSKYKKYPFVLISTKTKENLEELKEKIFKSFDKIRAYTKEPGKESDKKRPMILKQDSTIEDVAEKILKGFSEKIKQIKIWGPSSKFSGQVVGLKHKIKDLDIVEFKTK
jgi:ribosome-interacting GTPase 1